ncbi:MAG: hydrogenase maturation nickel metallochaperone HypA [Deltaproteobacteria bacterium]|jgi:hydrogenase nickel incorporation protein HypA/HybF|nr:hydrogenase maturation nickel metallochaperone HypA [Deltaproteobacteria bacterium]MBT4090606.1 hydrogenase maturation nickel metallochaperone HypA [Deltaproteobacteria bacterium]MBT4263210.1 hydrogenase maturation nickel metallochaperone HypA [Deltaproteobacteria bacterium]MBT4640958.1 hydrogenase maturation nickel metallochaperone HypA [Deltaproteobacteria bacterium]MBT6501823.1 hydrogenase maturation nickel metallochaperone HypA [Deltaproteobacteria bacterium]
MHELPVTEKILDIIVAHAERNNVQKVVTINLNIGELSDLEDEWIQNYFDYLAKGSVAEGAKLVIEKVPVVMNCNGCSNTFQVDIKEMKEMQCPDCDSKDYTLISGKDYYIKNMEVV